MNEHEFQTLAAEYRRRQAETEVAFAELIRLNDVLRASGRSVTYGPLEGNSVRAYHAGPAGESFALGAEWAEDREPHDAALGEQIEAAANDWRAKAIAASTALQNFDGALARLRAELLGPTTPPAALPADS